MDLDAVYDMAQRHMLSAICASAIESAGIRDQRFVKAWGRAVRKTALMDSEREKLFHSMDAAGIWYLPLKGCVIKNYYPAYGMREMSDNDILFDESRAADVKAILKGQGFETKRFGLTAHDVYHKKPMYNFEMHRMLFGGSAPLALRTYYNDVKRLMISNGVGTSGHHMSCNNFYVYLVAHEYKHYNIAGADIKSLLDIYVFLKILENELEWDYINNQLRLLEISDFEHNNRILALAVFSNRQPSPENVGLLAYIVGSGSYGNLDQQIANMVRQKGRIGYLIQRVFLPYSDMTERYPVLKRAPILLPALWTHRIVKAATTKPGRALHMLAGAFHKQR